MSEFSSLGLSQPLMQAIQEAGYTQATPIQAKSIMPIAEGRDVLGIAQTGTGKTAAFAIPLLERMLKKPGKAGPGRMRILVLTPTRELAAQVEASFRKYGKHVRLSTAVIFGGVGQGQQVKALSRGLDLVVATPGRLLDLMQQRHAKFDQVETFVLDEADRMLDMGFIRDIRKIVAVLPPVRQTLLFSATLPDEIAHLAAEQLKDPIRVEVAPPSTTVERVTQTLCFVDKSKKRDLLRHFLADKSIAQALVFTRTKHGADRVTEDLLAHGIEAGAIHGNKAQNHRERTLRAYRNGTLRVLVATDIAARGLDIPGVSHVFNFDLPDEPESYVHRIGRTARAGREGVAVAFCSHDELEQLRDVERNIGMVLEVDDKQPLHIALQRMPERGR
ncbi:MAG TPA: DEAD/DEAH box helicase, partial [bacterium]|nr:DEAD/DEAH box helicase [bacterium]